MNIDPTPSRSRYWLAGCALALVCLVGLAATAALAAYFYEDGVIWLTEPTGGATFTPAQEALASPSATPSPPATSTTTSAQAPRNPLFGGVLPTALARDGGAARPALGLNLPPSIVQDPRPELGLQQLEALLLSDYPVHDFFEASQRLGGYDVGSRTVTATPYQLGDRQRFLVDEVETEATLLAVTDHAYFWAEETLQLDPALVQSTAERFETEYYPRLAHVFGQEWRPGVDNDAHFSVLHLDYMDSSTDELGHFNSGDEFPRSFFSGSNQQEIVYLNMSNLTLGSDLYFGTLVHEFQHLSQWYVDPNESAWLNEGLSQLAEIYLGLETADSIDYLLAPDTRLNTWSYSGDDVYAHYAAAYLFCVYLWEQLGEAAVQELARHPANGIAAVDAVLKGFRPDMTLEQFMADWVAANYLDDDAAGPQYVYQTLDLRPASSVEGVSFVPQELLHTLDQYAAHYIDLDLAGPTEITFAGDTTTRFLPTTPHSGNQVWFAPAQDTLNAHLTRRFDLRDLDSATLNYWAWYDLKLDLDYGYVTISTDEGQTWRVLDLAGGRDGDYGAAYNGTSSSAPGAQKGGWVEETIALDPYVGQSVLIRFELITYYDSDARGLAVDDITIPELGYLHDVEDGVDGWQAAGFVQVGSHLPQQWRVQLIQKGAVPQVSSLDLDEFNQGQWTVDIGPEGAVLAVMPLTPFAVEPANYWLAVE